MDIFDKSHTEYVTCRIRYVYVPLFPDCFLCPLDPIPAEIFISNMIFEVRHSHVFRNLPRDGRWTKLRVFGPSGCTRLSVPSTSEEGQGPLIFLFLTRVVCTLRIFYSPPDPSSEWTVSDFYNLCIRKIRSQRRRQLTPPFTDRMESP